MPLKENTLILYKNPYFLETGSYLGDGIEKAISAGFQTIISIELSQKYFELCTKKFSMHSNKKWHQQAIALFEEIRDTSSPSLASIMKKDLENILFENISLESE